MFYQITTRGLMKQLSNISDTYEGPNIRINVFGLELKRNRWQNDRTLE